MTPDEFEIKKALNSIGPLKSPGHDGLHAVFYQKNWEITKGKIISSIQHIFHTGEILVSWGDTLLCLIPKLENAYKASHFRPLGLCNTHYKILTKILANRIKPYLPSLISPFQEAFIPRRHSTDLFMIAHETMLSMNQSNKKEGWLILKIDLKKAFDTIS